MLFLVFLLVIETFYETIANMLYDNLGSKGQQYFPFVFVLFLFVLLSNLIGLIPFFPFTLLPSPFWLSLKICIFVTLFCWIRAALPRYRYDQLMALGWKTFLPISLAWLLLTSSILISFNWLPF